jgi:hypothetical protein
MAKIKPYFHNVFNVKFFLMFSKQFPIFIFMKSFISIVLYMDIITWTSLWYNNLLV